MCIVHTPYRADIFLDLEGGSQKATLVVVLRVVVVISSLKIPEELVQVKLVQIK